MCSHGRAIGGYTGNLPPNLQSENVKCNPQPLHGKNHYAGATVGLEAVKWEITGSSPAFDLPCQPLFELTFWRTYGNHKLSVSTVTSQIAIGRVTCDYDMVDPMELLTGDHNIIASRIHRNSQSLESGDSIYTGVCTSAMYDCDYHIANRVHWGPISLIADQ